LREVAGRPLDITAVLTDLVDGLTRWVGAGLDEAALEEYRSRCHTLGKQVVFTEAGVRRSGTAIDISPDRGGLLVRLEGGEVREVTSGEVRHVRSVKG
ncbi:MAG: biotin--[acetyl-CoA-carboxylase] ligase, partial [Thermoplasmata archaeon]|nr:biotin--[acetyl-CoA-carboxylase] ligase [Thermoplasmata archaeon]